MLRNHHVKRSLSTGAKSLAWLTMSDMHARFRFDEELRIAGRCRTHESHVDVQTNRAVSIVDLYLLLPRQDGQKSRSLWQSQGSHWCYSDCTSSFRVAPLLQPLSHYWKDCAWLKGTAWRGLAADWCHARQHRAFLPPSRKDCLGQVS